ncbi:hypothetical protein [Desulfosediminicola flagellatus]|uniref:hypothetical protein n=1 Tax=Desulfosediminicola flagellatus TaxID=2569541 RepID=UPI0010AD491E|nr:hypothetical protein [Desulfosediminicola flagellatus]
MFAKWQLSELVGDAVIWEGIDFTPQEIQTLLDGIPAGGPKASDQEIALKQANVWRQLFKWVEPDQFV